MKSVLIGKVVEGEIEYPSLRIASSGCVVLFYAPQKGSVVHFPGESNLGHYKDTWQMESFELLQGKITLSN